MNRAHPHFGMQKKRSEGTLLSARVLFFYFTNSSILKVQRVTLAARQRPHTAMLGQKVDGICGEQCANPEMKGTQSWR